MKTGMEFKVCGLTRVSDAKAAEAAGASFLGFIFYHKSPRRIELERFREIAADLPDLPKVAVTVVPTIEELIEFDRAGFDFFQIHFPLSKRELIPEWAKTVGKNRLWLAPKIGPDEKFDPACLDCCETILWDGFKKDPSTFGGTGKTSDWLSFKELQRQYPDTRWILAGGLSPENAIEAVAKTGAKVLDFNSGLETSPGIKDLDRISMVKLALSGK